jgi:hypothetical protein
MASPFPGMDPYIEQPALWPDFHADLAGEIRAALNRVIQPRYVALLSPYTTYELVEIGEVRAIRPDVGVQPAAPEHVAGPAGGPAITPAPVLSLLLDEVALDLYSVEVRATDDRALVTAMEILSPVNKRRGHRAYEDYRRKRQDLLHSDAHFIELDLLREGDRSPLARPVPPAPYYVSLSRATRRPTVEVWPIQLADVLPVVPVPLSSPDPDVALDLGALVASVYERAGYGTLIDYRLSPPPPPLSAAEDAWLTARLRDRGLRSAD